MDDFLTFLGLFFIAFILVVIGAVVESHSYDKDISNGSPLIIEGKVYNCGVKNANR